MSKRRIIAVIVAGALVLGIVVLAYVEIHGVRTTDLSTMQSLAEKNIKIGMSPDEVIRFLDSQKLEHSPLWRPHIMIIGPHDYGNSLAIDAIKRRTMESLFAYENIEIVFAFNEEHELERFDVFPVVTGL